MSDMGWTSEWPTEGEWWAWHPKWDDGTPQLVECTQDTIYFVAFHDEYVHIDSNDGRWRFHPVSWPAPPKE